MSSRSLTIALASLAAIACGGKLLLSPPNNWGGDFTDRSPSTDECPGGTVTQLRTHMAISEPLALAEIGADIPDPVRSRIAKSDRFYAFRFTTAPDSGDFWGFSGYLVARGDCIIHAKTTGHDN